MCAKSIVKSLFKDLDEKPTLFLLVVIFGVFISNLFKISDMVSKGLSPQEISTFVGLSTANMYDPSMWIFSMFSHVSIVHLIVNVIVLGSFGLVFEKYVRGIVYYVFFVVVGLLASFSQILAFMYVGDVTPMLGSSGAIAGIIGFLLVARPHDKIYLFFIIPVRFSVGIFIFVVGSLSAILYGGFGAFGMGHTAHLVGLFSGISFAYLYLDNPYNIVSELFTWYFWSDSKKRGRDIVSLFEMTDNRDIITRVLLEKYDPNDEVEFGSRKMTVIELIQFMYFGKLHKTPSELREAEQNVLTSPS